MPFVECPHCHESTFTISGWAPVDHCPACGCVLSERKAAGGGAEGAGRPLGPLPMPAPSGFAARAETGA